MQLVRTILLLLCVCAAPAHALDARAYIERAVELIESEDYSFARTYLDPAVIDPRLTSGERSRAYYLRGYSFASQGMHVSAFRDYNRALEFHPGNPVVLVEVGLAHAYGRGTDEDKELAFGFFEQAAEEDYAPGHFQMGHAWLMGSGVEKDIEKAREALQKAADDGHGFAMINLAASYRGQHVDDPQPEIAKAWYEKAINSGEPRGHLFLGFMYARGELGEPDHERAAALYQEALDAGVHGAAVNLAYAYLTGTGVEEDVSRAFELYQTAADAGVVSSYVGLAHMYQYGQGTERDVDEAVGWYERAAAAGAQDAMNRLVSIYLGRADEPSRTLALKWSKQAAMTGNAQAHNDYAWLLATSKFAGLRNGPLAVDQAKVAVASEANASYLDTLAAAYAELGNFQLAVATQQSAIEAITSEDGDIRSELEVRLKHYERQEAWRE